MLLLIRGLLSCLLFMACGGSRDDGSASAITGAGAGRGGDTPAAAGASASGQGGAGGEGGMAGAMPNGGRGGSVAGAGSAGADPNRAGAGGGAGAAGSIETGAAGAAAVSCAAGDFCDSFESAGGALDPARWSVVSPSCSGDGVVELDSSISHSGTSSLRVRGSGGYCNHVFATPVSVIPAAIPLYGRLYVRFERALTAAHVTFATLRDAGEGKDLRLGGQSEILMWNRESDDATLPELSPAGIALSVKPAVNEWLCIEFMLDREQRQLSTWVDGEAVPALQVDGEPTQDVDGQWLRKPDWTPMPADLKLGWESYGSDANTLWFDDVALGAQRFGC